jgi:hypothetical protein
MLPWLMLAWRPPFPGLLGILVFLPFPPALSTSPSPVMAAILHVSLNTCRRIEAPLPPLQANLGKGLATNWQAFDCYRHQGYATSDEVTEVQKGHKRHNDATCTSNIH